MKKNLTILSVAATTIALTVGYTIAQADDTTTPPAVKSEHKEHHPAIHAAIKSLEKAKAELQAASHDFGGHRADAVAQCDKALEQLKLALQFDKQ